MLSLTKKFAAIGNEKRQVRASVLSHQNYLEPGRWWLVEPAIGRHAGFGQLPLSLSTTKGLAGFNEGRVRNLLRKFLYRVIPPLTVTTQRQSGDSAQWSGEQFSLLVMTKSGDVVLVDRAQSQVLKIGTQSHISPAQQAIRERLARHVKLPDVQFFNQGKIVLEPFAQGAVFAAESASKRRHYFTSLIDQYCTLTNNEREPAEQNYWQRAIQFSQTLPLDDDVHHLIGTNANDWITELSTLPFAPAHGDLSGANIVVSDKDMTMYDLEDCALLPAFFDVYFLAHQEWLCGRKENWLQLIEDPVWQTIRSALRVNINQNTWLLGMLVCELYEWRTKKGGVTFSKELMGRWWGPFKTILQESSNNTDTLPERSI